MIQISKKCCIWKYGSESGPLQNQFWIRNSHHLIWHPWGTCVWWWWPRPRGRRGWAPLPPLPVHYTVLVKSEWIVYLHDWHTHTHIFSGLVCMYLKKSGIEERFSILFAARKRAIMVPKRPSGNTNLTWYGPYPPGGPRSLCCKCSGTLEEEIYRILVQISSILII